MQNASGPKAQGGTLKLLKAAEDGKLDDVRRLVERKANLETTDVFVFGCTPLIKAAGSGHLDVVRWLLQAGADLKAKDNDGRNSLNAAALCKKLNVVKFLVEEAGASVETKDNAGNTPEMNAASRGHQDVVEWLKDVKTHNTKPQSHNNIMTQRHNVMMTQ